MKTTSKTRKKIIEFSSSVAHAEATRLAISPKFDAAKRAELGQFFTSSQVAEFIASMFGALPSKVRLLDAGAGVGALTAAFVRMACDRERRPDAVDVTLYEIDQTLLPLLHKTLDACRIECQKANITFTAKVLSDDYLVRSSAPLFGDLVGEAPYNFAVLNPPYGKIGNRSAQRAAIGTIGIETVNLYSAFVAVALNQLEREGQLVAITPRSFCNGTYFESFRKYLIANSAIKRFHLYESRKTAFRDDAVLQENIVFRLDKGARQPETIEISCSVGPGADVSTRSIPYEEFVFPTDRHKFFRLVTSEAGSHLANRISLLPCALSSLGINVSTGRVVDFRVKGELRVSPEPGSVPLIYAQHFSKGFVTWPKEGRKPNAIMLNSLTKGQVIPNETFVLTKRFTSKEEKRRLSAVIYNPECAPGEFVAFENHLNYFHCASRGLASSLALGLAIFLNSTAVDQFFRQFSGHTQVNANDLRNLPYPNLEQLIALGEKAKGTMPDQDTIDALLEPLL